MAKVRILLVEESPASRQEAGSWLDALGFDYDAVATGQEAVKIARSHDYAMILMNLTTPEGLAAVQRIRDEGNETPAAAFTANPQEEDKSRCRASGVNTFLPRALDKSELAQLLGRWISTEAQWLD